MKPKGPAPIADAQRKAIFGLAKKKRMDDDQLHAAVLDETGKGSLKLLTFRDADKVIVRLGGRPFGGRRTVQHHRKEAGVEQVVQTAQLEYIAALASQRGWSPETLKAFCLRQAKTFPLQTTKQANSVIEALKAMNKRDGLWTGK